MLLRNSATIHLADIEPATRKCEYSSSSATLIKSFIGYVRQSRSCTFATRRDVRTAECPSRAAQAGAGEGNRTLVCSLGSCRSTIELHPHRRSDLAETARSAKRLGGAWRAHSAQP